MNLIYSLIFAALVFFGILIAPALAIGVTAIVGAIVTFWLLRSYKSILKDPEPTESCKPSTKDE